MSYEYRPNSFRASVLRGEKQPLLVSEKHPKQEGSADLTGSVVPREEVRRSDHRDADRHRLVDQLAVLTLDGDKHTVEVNNLSAGGAMIRCGFEPRLWDMVEIELGEGYALECAVRWLRDGCIGLEFAHETQIECAPDERAAVLLEVIQRIGAAVSEWLRPGGVAVIEISETQGPAASAAFIDLPTVVRQDLAGRDRYVVAVKP